MSELAYVLWMLGQRLVDVVRQRKEFRVVAVGRINAGRCEARPLGIKSLGLTRPEPSIQVIERFMKYDRKLAFDVINGLPTEDKNILFFMPSRDSNKRPFLGEKRGIDVCRRRHAHVIRDSHGRHCALAFLNLH